MSEKVQYPREWWGEKRGSFCKKWACELCGFNFVPLTLFTSSTKCFSHRSVFLTTQKRMCQNWKLELLLPQVKGKCHVRGWMDWKYFFLIFLKPRMAKLVLMGLIFLTVKPHWIKIFNKRNPQRSLLPENHAQPETALPKELKVVCNNAANHSVQQAQTHSVAVSPQGSIYGVKSLDLLYSIWTVVNENLPKIRIINSFTQAVFLCKKKAQNGSEQNK